MEFRIKKSWKDISYREILLCPYEDKMLALWVKLAFWLVWLINIPAGIIYGASFQYIAYVLSIVFAIGINIAISAKNYNIWIDFITLALVSIPVYGIFFSAYIKAFSVMYPVFF
jgi:hypothetical protein